jgi:hypothetical protein
MALMPPPGEAVIQVVDWVEAIKSVTVSSNVISEECIDEQRKVFKRGILL